MHYKRKENFFFFFLENRSHHVKGIAKLSQIFFSFVPCVRYTILERSSHLLYLLCQQALTEQKMNMLLFMLLIGGNTNVISDNHFMGI